MLPAGTCSPFMRKESARSTAPSRIVKMETSDVLLRPISVWYYADALGVDPKPLVSMVLQDLLQRECGKKFSVTLK